MNKLKIKYISPCLDNSGYGKASRGYILALHKLGVPITISPISFEGAHPELGEDGKVIKSLINKDIDYNVVIIHSTPEFWEKYREEGKVNIGYTIWETTQLHPEWPVYINNNVDKVLVGCSWNVDVFKDSGVTIPIGCVPHGIPIKDATNITPYSISGVDEDTYVFGFVSQWTERKSPLSLIKAYWHAFQGNENVALVMKTYRSDYSDQEKDAIRSTIKRLKYVTKFDNYPKILFIPDMLSEDEMRGLYKRLDCYVSLDRGEGFGLSPFTAGAYGKPVIATGFGGVTEYLKEDNSYLVNYTLTPVHGMPWSPWYNGNQLWSEPDVKHGADLMQYVYNNRTEAQDKGAKLEEYIKTNFSEEVVGRKMIKEIEALL